MNRPIFLFIFIEILFLFISTIYIPFTLATDIYLSAHREKDNCFIEKPTCSYDNEFATQLAKFTEYKNSSVTLNIVSNGAENLADTIANGRTKSLLQDIFIISFSMLVLNEGLAIYLTLDNKFNSNRKPAAFSNRR